MATTLERLTKIVVDRLGVDPAQVTMEAKFQTDLKADSLDLVELIMDIQDEFKGEVDDEDARKIVTVGDAVNLIETRLKKAA